MSAIAAILRFHGEPIRDGEIERLTVAMKARSPDGITTWRDGSIALGHGQLHGTPESLAERQPLASADGRFRLIWDGRLDNRAALRHELALHRAEPRDDTDAELVLQAYFIHGQQTPERLLGDFAFAIWDARDHRLFCARDHVGARPFYYAQNDHFFALASEDEALLTLDGVSAKPNEDRIVSALVGSFDAFDWQNSWFEDVAILMPGSRLSVDISKRFRRETYWSMVPHDGPALHRSNEDIRREFAQVFGRAVSNRMRSHRPIAAMMSGGMDSVSVCAMATRFVRERGLAPLRTFSAVEDAADTCIESRSILQMADRLQLNAAFLRVPSFEGFGNKSDVERVFKSWRHPTDDALTLVAMMCLGAARDGCNVLLHGASGDVASYTPLNYLSTVLQTRGWSASWRELCLAKKHHTYLGGGNLFAEIGRVGYKEFAPMWLRNLRAHWHEHVGDRRGRWAGLRPEFVDSRQLVRRQLRRFMADEVVSRSAKLEHLGVLFPNGILRGLEGYERVAGHFGVEMRDPWSDKDVLEFMLNAPVSFKTGDGWTKYAIRQEFECDVGSNVVWRSDKTHLGWRFVDCASAADACGPTPQKLHRQLEDIVLTDMDGTASSLGAWLDRTGS